MDRSQKIIRVSLQAIGINLFLVIIKIAVALVSGSLAIFLDGINNLSDGLSSILVIVAARLSRKPRDREHPYGFGRIEYLGTLVLALLILFTGYQALVESIDKILHPQSPDYGWASFVVLAVSVAVKYFFGTYLKKQGEKLNALSLSAAGSDASLDALISLSTLIAALIFVLSGINLDGWMGALIALLIIRTGLEVLREGTSSLIGNRADAELSSQILESVSQTPGVLGAYDLILHDYGPDTQIGSVHIEVSDQMSAVQIDQLSRRITQKIYSQFSTLLTIGIYASNSTQGASLEMEKEIRSFVLSRPGILQLHGYYMDEAQKSIQFDLVYSQKLSEPEKTAHALEKELEERFAPYHFHIVMDYDYTLS